MQKRNYYLGVTCLLFVVVLMFNSQASIPTTSCHNVPEKNPYALYKKWYQSAKLHNMSNKYAVLATNDKQNHPQIRMTRLSYHPSGLFYFYNRVTNQKKMSNINHNAPMSLMVYWHKKGDPDYLQIKIEGKTKPMDKAFLIQEHNAPPTYIKGYQIIPSKVSFVKLNELAKNMNLTHVTYEYKKGYWRKHGFCEEVKSKKQVV